MSEQRAVPGRITGVSRTITTSTVFRFLHGRVTNGVLVAKDPKVDEVKIPGIAEVGINGLYSHGITHYYPLLGALLEQDFYVEDCVRYLKSVGVAPGFAKTVVILCWNHLRFGDLAKETTNHGSAAFRNGGLVPAESKEYREVFIRGVEHHDIQRLKDAGITTYFKLIGKIFTLEWKREEYDRYMSGIGVSTSASNAIWNSIRYVIHLDEIAGIN